MRRDKFQHGGTNLESILGFGDNQQPPVDAGVPDTGNNQPDTGNNQPDAGTPDTGSNQPDVGTGGAGPVFGIEADGTLYHLDGGQTGNFVFLCVNGDCRTATRNGNRWERETGFTSGSYNIEFKIQDNATGQCIATANGVTPGSGVSSSPCTSAVGGQPDAGTGTPDTGSQQPDVGNQEPDVGNQQPDAGTPDTSTGGGDFVFGIEADGTLYHVNGGQTGGFVYLCLNGDCRTGQLNGNRYERATGVTSGSYNIEFKIQDNATGQCIATAGGVSPGGGVSSSPCQ